MTVWMLHIGENIVPIQLLVGQMLRLAIVRRNLTTKVDVVGSYAHTYTNKRIVMSCLRHNVSIRKTSIVVMWSTWGRTASINPTVACRCLTQNGSWSNVITIRIAGHVHIRRLLDLLVLWDRVRCVDAVWVVHDASWQVFNWLNLLVIVIVLVPVFSCVVWFE